MPCAIIPAGAPICGTGIAIGCVAAPYVGEYAPCCCACKQCLVREDPYRSSECIPRREWDLVFQRHSLCKTLDTKTRVLNRAIRTW
jgi:hypothetical protein